MKMGRSLFLENYLRKYASICGSPLFYSRQFVSIRGFDLIRVNSRFSIRGYVRS